MGNEGSTGARPDAGFKDVALIHDLPRMVLIIEKWFERSIVRSTPRSSRHHCCRILLDGREVGRCASFPSSPMYIDPKRSNSTITVQLFANDCTFGVKDVEDVESIPPSSETSLDPEKTGVEETGLNDSIDLVASLDLNKGLCGELSFEVGRLVQYGAPLYTSLCLGLHPGNSTKEQRRDLAQALQTAADPSQPRVCITIFKPSRVDTKSGRSGKGPSPDVGRILEQEFDVCGMGGDSTLSAKWQVQGLIECVRNATSTIDAMDEQLSNISDELENQREQSELLNLECARKNQEVERLMNASSGVNAELKRLEQERESLEKQLQDRQPDRRALGNDDVLQQRLNERSEELAFAVKQIVELQDDAERKQKALDSGNKELQALKAELTCCRTELRAFRQGSRGVLPQGPAPVAGPKRERRAVGNLETLPEGDEEIDEDGSQHAGSTVGMPDKFRDLKEELDQAKRDLQVSLANQQGLQAELVSTQKKLMSQQHLEQRLKHLHEEVERMQANEALKRSGSMQGFVVPSSAPSLTIESDLPSPQASPIHRAEAGSTRDFHGKMVQTPAEIPKERDELFFRMQHELTAARDELSEKNNIHQEFLEAQQEIEYYKAGEALNKEMQAAITKTEEEIESIRVVETHRQELLRLNSKLNSELQVERQSKRGYSELENSCHTFQAELSALRQREAELQQDNANARAEHASESARAAERLRDLRDRLVQHDAARSPQVRDLPKGEQGLLQTTQVVSRDCTMHHQDLGEQAALLEEALREEQALSQHRLASMKDAEELAELDHQEALASVESELKTLHAEVAVMTAFNTEQLKTDDRLQTQVQASHSRAELLASEVFDLRADKDELELRVAQLMWHHQKSQQNAQLLEQASCGEKDFLACELEAVQASEVKAKEVFNEEWAVVKGELRHLYTEKETLETKLASQQASQSDSVDLRRLRMEVAELMECGDKQRRKLEMQSAVLDRVKASEQYLQGERMTLEARARNAQDAHGQVQEEAEALRVQNDVGDAKMSVLTSELTSLQDTILHLRTENDAERRAFRRRTASLEATSSEPRLLEVDTESFNERQPVQNATGVLQDRCLQAEHNVVLLESKCDDVQAQLVVGEKEAQEQAMSLTNLRSELAALGSESEVLADLKGNQNLLEARFAELQASSSEEKELYEKQIGLLEQALLEAKLVDHAPMADAFNDKKDWSALDAELVSLRLAKTRLEARDVAARQRAALEEELSLVRETAESATYSDGGDSSLIPSPRGAPSSRGEPSARSEASTRGDTTGRDSVIQSPRTEHKKGKNRDSAKQVAYDVTVLKLFRRVLFEKFRHKTADEIAKHLGLQNRPLMIARNEVDKALRSCKQYHDSFDMQQVFRKIDVNGTGHLALQDLRVTLVKMGALDRDTAEVVCSIIQCIVQGKHSLQMKVRHTSSTHDKHCRPEVPQIREDEFVNFFNNAPFC